MEKSLLDKLESETIDDVDKMMICSRVANASKNVFLESAKFAKKMEQFLTDEFKDELRMAGFGIVFAVTDNTVFNGKPVVKVVWGSPSIVEGLVENMTKENG